MTDKAVETKSSGHTLRSISLGILVIGAIAGSVLGTLKTKEEFDRFVEERVAARLADLQKNTVIINKNSAVMTTVWTSPSAKEPVRKTMALDDTKCQELKASNTQANTAGGSTLSVDCLPVDKLFSAAPDAAPATTN